MFGGGILQKMYMEYGIPVYVYDRRRVVSIR